MNKENKTKNKKNKYLKWYFLLSVIILYLILLIFSLEKTKLVTAYFIKLLIQIIPIFIFVYILMFLTNYFVDNNFLKKHMGEDAGIKGWLIAIIAGILSVGPIYAWYPLMKDLQKKGVKNRFLAAFLYNRGIKLQWLPMLIVYFGWVFSAVLLIVMAVFSILQGITTEKLSNE